MRTPDWTSPCGTVQLHLADCLDVLGTIPKGTVDAVVTDPPYGIDYGRAGGFSASHGWGPWREQVTWDQSRPVEQAFREMLTCSREQIIWGGNYFADMLPPRMRWLAWDKGQRNFSLADMELAWTSQQNAARIFTYPRGKAIHDGKEHPTQKPLALMEWCLEFIPNAQTILDPYMGVATTGVACVRTGRRFIGIEIEPRYFEIAVKRIERALRDKAETFPEMRPEAKAIQGAMFE